MADRMAELDQTAEAVDNEFRQMLAGVPNTPHESVPDGQKLRR